MPTIFFQSQLQSASNQIFKKEGGLDWKKGLKISTFRGGDFFQGGCNSHIKNKVRFTEKSDF